MQLPNGSLGIIMDKNPLIRSPFIEEWTGIGVTPPPFGASVRITNEGDVRVTNDYDTRITNYT